MDDPQAPNTPPDRQDSDQPRGRTDSGSGGGGDSGGGGGAQHPVAPGRDAPSAIELGERAWVHRDAVDLTMSRASGPGGQSVNKLNSRVQLRIAVEAISGLDDQARARLRHKGRRRLTASDEILIQCGQHRSQLDNRRTCIARLSALVAEAEIVPRKRIRRGPTRAMIRKRLKAKRQQSEKKQNRRWRNDDG